ncbi:MAG: extracellular solute-binding protein [Eubacterium aggregans]
MKLFISLTFALISLIVLTSGCGQGAKKVALDPQNPTKLTIWHYYNGAQQQAFAKAIAEFNAGEGAKQGIQVSESTQGTVSDLAKSVMAAAQKKVGAHQMPNIFAAYSDTAYELDQMGTVADLSPYFTEKERQAYIDGYIEEGDFFNNGSLKIFPVAKSTEILSINETDWQKFADATGASKDELKTIEGITKTAKAYYEWTNAQTPDIPNDGKAFSGRDDFANYMIIGSRQLGTEIFSAQNGQCTLNFDKAVMHKLWDNYYVPMIAGWFDEENRFRSDDIKTGRIIACVGSYSSASFLPSQCILSDTESYPITLSSTVATQFEGGKACAVQQGTGMVVTESDEKEVYAYVQFLKWFTQPQQNATFSVQSGYLPLTKKASTESYLASVMTDNRTNEKVVEALNSAAKTTENNEIYTNKAFNNGGSAISILEHTLPQKAEADRKALLEMVSNGADYNTALAQLNTDANFDAWYNDTLSQLKVALAQE